MRIIDADALVEWALENHSPSDMITINRMCGYVKTMPTADTESILNGEWKIHIYKYGMDRYECSECAQTCDRAYKYCPHCGAKMDSMRKVRET